MKGREPEPQDELHEDYSVRPLNPDRLAALRAYAGKSILDVGCGNGVYVYALSGEHDIKGVDYKHFRAWERRPDLFAISDAVQLALPDASVDTIVSFETLEHLPDPGAALREYARVARKNLILTVPNCAVSPGILKSGLIYSHWSDRTHLHFFDMPTLVALVEANGFRVTVSKLINRVNLGHAVLEALGFSGLPARVGARLFRVIQRRQQYITSLIVAEKKG